MTNIEQTLSIVCDIKLEIYLMPLDAFGEAEDCGPAFWQLCIHPVNILIDKYPKITLKYTKYVSTENMWILRDPLLLSFLTKDDVDRAIIKIMIMILL